MYPWEYTLEAVAYVDTKYAFLKWQETQDTMRGFRICDSYDSTDSTDEIDSTDLIDYILVETDSEGE